MIESSLVESKSPWKGKRRTFCLVLPEQAERTERAKVHFEDAGLIGVEWFVGLHAETSGLTTTHFYELDNPGTNFCMGPKPVAIWLAHYMLWQHLARLPDEYVMIVEVDARFQEGWQKILTESLGELPEGFDFFYPGHCCVSGSDCQQIGNSRVWRARPQCTHCYIVRCAAVAKALPLLRKVYAPWDIMLALEVLPLFNAYAILPRIVDQFDTDLPP